MKRGLSKKNSDAMAIFQAGLEAVAPGAAIKRHCRLEENTLRVGEESYALAKFKKIVVIGAGKAGASMALAIEEILGDRIDDGLITVKYGYLEALEKIRICEAGHPVPDAKGLAAARKIFELARAADEQTLIICLISGGGSALMPLPVEGVSLEDKQETTRVLLACGATIQEINALRKHLSVIKGGGLARAVYPATLITLILSDVIGDDLDSIASGPCVPDLKTFADCRAILGKYGIENQIPANVRDYLGAGIRREVPETPKAGEGFFDRTQNLIVASNFDALLQARIMAEKLGYNCLLLSSMFEGDTRDLAVNHMAIAREIRLHGYPLMAPACILSGGETTVKLHGSGKGGRNQEFVLAAALKMTDLEGVVVLSAGTDGTDGPTDAAGAFADATTVARAEARGLDPRYYLNNNDSYHFFANLEDLFKTGPTNTNVMDMRIILIDR